MELLRQSLQRGFFGTAGVERSIQDGTIQHIRRKVDRIEKVGKQRDNSGIRESPFARTGIPPGPAASRTRLLAGLFFQPTCQARTQTLERRKERR